MRRQFVLLWVGLSLAVVGWCQDQQDSSRILHDSLTFTACDSLEYGGKWYTGPTQFLDTIQGTSGQLDTLRTIRLNIKPSAFTQDWVQACDSFFYRNDFIRTSTEMHETWMAWNGCDSVHRTHVEIGRTSHSNQTVRICRGDSFLMPNGLWVMQGSYELVLSSQQGCDSIVAYQIEYHQLDLGISADLEKCIGETVRIEVEVFEPFQSLLWSTGEGEYGIWVEEAGTYRVDIEDPNGCIHSGEVVVEDADCPLCPMFIPNAITVDGNGRNDAFKPVHRCAVDHYELELFNRWGQSVFRTTDPDEQWNGRANEETVPNETYIWTLRYQDLNSKKWVKRTGSLNVFR